MATLRRWFLPLLWVPLWALAAGSHAEEGSLEAMMPWDGEGRVFDIGPDLVLFQGAFEGILYVETAQGDLDAAFALCPGSQRLDTAAKTTNASGHCMITGSGGDTVYAQWRCKGELGVCRGRFELTGGTGRFEGISGASELQVRSVLSALVLGMGSGSTVRAASGLAILPKLTYSIPDR